MNDDFDRFLRGYGDGDDDDEVFDNAAVPEDDETDDLFPEADAVLRDDGTEDDLPYKPHSFFDEDEDEPDESEDEPDESEDVSALSGDGEGPFEEEDDGSEDVPPTDEEETIEDEDVPPTDEEETIEDEEETPAEDEDEVPAEEEEEAPAEEEEEAPAEEEEEATEDEEEVPAAEEETPAEDEEEAPIEDEEEVPAEEEPAEESDESEDEKSEKGEDRAISSDLIRGHINTIILRALYDGDKYGYEIIAEIEKKSHGQYSLKQPSLYSALKRLEKEGYITSYWGGSVSGGRRKYFSLTDEGKDISERNQTEWEYSRTVIDSLISDKEFDFARPAPAAVDMRVLKQSTSRVPEREGDDGEFEYDEPDNFGAEEALASKLAAFEEERARYEESMRVREEVLRAREEAGTKREQELLEREFALAAEEEERARLEAQRREQELEAQRQQQEALEAQRREQELELQRQQQEALEAQRREQEALELQRQQQEALEAQRREQELEAQRQQQEALEAQRQQQEALELQRQQQEALEAQRREQEALEAQRREQEALARQAEEVERARAQALSRQKEEQNARILETEPFAEERAHYEQMLRDQEEELTARYRRELALQEARIREEDEHNFRLRQQQMMHQNYLDLVNGGPQDEQPATSYYYEPPQTAESYTYIGKPEAEREYRSIIRKLYSNAAGKEPTPPQETAPMAPAVPAPPPQPAPAPQPIVQAEPQAAEPVKAEPKAAPAAGKARVRSLDGIDFYDLESRAAQDGIRICTSSGNHKETTERSESLVHRGKALFLSALVVFLLLLAEGSLALGFQSRLSLPRFYPIFIWGSGLILVLVTGLLFLNRYGERSLRRTGNLLVNVIVSYALCVILILIIALAARIDFSSAGELATFIIFPAVYFFSIVVFGIAYYVQVRPVGD